MTLAKIVVKLFQFNVSVNVCPVSLATMMVLIKFHEAFLRRAGRERRRAEGRLGDAPSALT